MSNMGDFDNFDDDSFDGEGNLNENNDSADETGIESVDQFLDMTDDNLKALADSGNAKAQMAYGFRQMADCYNYEEALKYFELSAAGGCADGLYFLGRAYYIGEGVEVDKKKSVELSLEAAEKGSVHAAHSLGAYYDTGDGVEQDYERAMAWFKFAAEKGYSPSQFRLGLMYENGDGIEPNMDYAMYWYELAAGQKNESALIALGLIYEYGKGVEPDPYKAREYYQIAADMENSIAMHNLGLMHMSGSGGPVDYETGFRYFEMAANKEESDSQYCLGRCYEYGDGVEQDYQSAVHWYEIASDNGHPAATRVLGVMYIYGTGVEPDMVKAANYMEKAVEMQDPIAMVNLGLMHLSGDGVPKDEQRALELFEKAVEAGNYAAYGNLGSYWAEEPHKDMQKALGYLELGAEHGDPYSQYALGVIYDYGDGVEKDSAKACGYYELAVENGHSFAMNNLAANYESGEGVEQNMAKALELYDMACEHGNAQSCIRMSLEYLRGMNLSEEDRDSDIDKRDLEKAMYYAEKGAETEDLAALGHLGEIYMREEKFRNPEEAEKLFMTTAREGYLNSFYCLYELYSNEKSPLYSPDKAEEVLEVGAQNGSSKCQYDLGYLNDEKENYDKTVYWYTKAAENNEIWAQYNLYLLYKNAAFYASETGADSGIVNELADNSLKYLQMAVENRDVDSLVQLGHLYRKGYSLGNPPVEILKKDTGKALEIFSEASLNSNGAAVIAGYMYTCDCGGIPVDYIKANEFFTLAAERGSVQGMYYLADQYLYGYGVKKDYDKAFEWYSRAVATDDSPNLLDGVGYCTYYGYGTAKDEEKGLEMIMQSAELGEWRAIAYLSQIYLQKGNLEEGYAAALNAQMHSEDDFIANQLASALKSEYEKVISPKIAGKILKTSEENSKSEVSKKSRVKNKLFYTKVLKGLDLIKQEQENAQ